MKTIPFSGHACERIEGRGATQQEITETIRAAHWRPAGGGRYECRRDFPYGR